MARHYNSNIHREAAKSAKGVWWAPAPRAFAGLVQRKLRGLRGFAVEIAVCFLEAAGSGRARQICRADLQAHPAGRGQERESERQLHLAVLLQEPRRRVGEALHD